MAIIVTKRVSTQLGAMLMISSTGSLRRRRTLLIMRNTVAMIMAMVITSIAIVYTIGRITMMFRRSSRT